MPPSRILWPLIAALATLPGSPTLESKPRDPRDGNLVIFFGDSITQAGGYVDVVAATLIAARPDQQIVILNRGIASETISGTSETDHLPRRHDAHDRFDRDVAVREPAIVVACFGMNDGNYFPFDPDRFEQFRAGINRLIERTRALGARLVILTPPPYDPYRRIVGDPNAVEYGYKFPAVNYDETLSRYSEWLATIEAADVEVVDLHTALNDHLKARRAHLVSFALTGDGVHPDPTGHWLMARRLLDHWGIRGIGASASWR